MEIMKDLTKKYYNSQQVELVNKEDLELINANTENVGWIKIEDRLPDFDKEVLICDKPNQEMAVGWLDRIDKDGPHFDWDNSREEFTGVSHWMELPEFPV